MGGGATTPDFGPDSGTASASGVDSGSEYVTLVSNDGYAHIVRREAAYVSGTLRRMLDPGSAFAEARTGRCTFDDISGVVLEKVVEYLYHNKKHEATLDAPHYEIPPELCLELLVAADYLNL